MIVAEKLVRRRTAANHVIGGHTTNGRATGFDSLDGGSSCAVLKLKKIDVSSYLVTMYDLDGHTTIRSLGNLS